MKTLARRIRRLPPEVVVLGAALAVVACVSIAHLTRIREVDARVVEEQEARRRTARAASDDVGGALRDPEELPAFREAYRIQECSGLALGLALVAIDRRLASGSPATSTAEIIAEACSRGILPPRVEVANSDTINGPYSSILVRYRPEPLGVEVISIPSTSVEADGAPILARVSAEAGAEAYTLLRTATPVVLPRPFASEAALEAARWKREILKDYSGTHGSLDDLKTLAAGEGRR